MAVSYWPKMARDYKGRQVRVLNDLKTKGGAQFKVGHIMVIHKKRGSLSLECLPGCKVKHREKRPGDMGRTTHFIRGVSKYSVELI